MTKLAEKEFLHALASPLGTAILLADSLKDSDSSSIKLSAAETTRIIDSLVETLEIIRKAFRERQNMEAS